MGARSLLVVAKDSPAQSLTAPVVGQAIGIADDGRPLIECEGMAGPIVARRLSTVTLQDLEVAIANGQGVLLVFERGDLALPIIVGILADERIVDDCRAERANVEAAPDAKVGSMLTASIDGKRIKLSAQDEIVLECGEASITLRRNGRVIIRGAYVETRSRGTNRIRGGTVRIN